MFGSAPHRFVIESGELGAFTDDAFGPLEFRVYRCGLGPGVEPVPLGLGVAAALYRGRALLDRGVM